MVEAFQDFLASAKEVSVQEFYGSDIAKQNCIDGSWFISLEPTCFAILGDAQWFAKFDKAGMPPIYWTMIEKEERLGDLPELAQWVYDWLYEEYGE